MRPPAPRPHHAPPSARNDPREKPNQLPSPSGLDNEKTATARSGPQHLPDLGEGLRLQLRPLRCHAWPQGPNPSAWLHAHSGFPMQECSNVFRVTLIRSPQQYGSLFPASRSLLRCEEAAIRCSDRQFLRGSRSTTRSARRLARYA